MYRGGSGSALVDKERRMLVENTEALLAQFAGETRALELAAQQTQVPRLTEEAARKQR